MRRSHQREEELLTEEAVAEILAVVGAEVPAEGDGGIEEPIGHT